MSLKLITQIRSFISRILRQINYIYPSHHWNKSQGQIGKHLTLGQRIFDQPQGQIGNRLASSKGIFDQPQGKIGKHLTLGQAIFDQPPNNL